jgi:hypothetical protein
MSKIRYEARSFNDISLGVIETAEAILDEYDQQGYKMSLRALYYQLVRRDLWPESRKFQIPGSDDYTANVQKNYKWLGDLLTDARVGGYIDWDHLEDPTREHKGGDGGFSSPEAAMRYLNRLYQVTKWDGQDHYLEVWVEKAALLPVIGPAARRWNVAFLACKGSPSTSAMHEVALRMRRWEDDGRETTILYLGDHDPTGIDISRDVQARLELFRSKCRVDRIALNWDQITDDLPPSPAKVTDSRTGGYVDQFGTTDTWELDAMEPAAMDALVDEAIQDRIEHVLWDRRVERENRERAVITAISGNWAAVQSWMNSEGMI